jgi:hypothetical protein
MAFVPGTCPRCYPPAYDAWYVALAESLGATLATVDMKLSAAPGPRCAFVTVPAEVGPQNERRGQRPVPAASFFAGLLI